MTHLRVELLEAEELTTAVLVAVVWAGVADEPGLPELELAEILFVEEVNSSLGYICTYCSCQSTCTGAIVQENNL